jgi:hypothetical protein
MQMLLIIGLGWMSFALPTLTIWRLTRRPNVAVDDINYLVVVLAVITGPYGFAMELKHQYNRRRI